MREEESEDPYYFTYFRITPLQFEFGMRQETMWPSLEAQISQFSPSWNHALKEVSCQYAMLNIVDRILMVIFSCMMNSIHSANLYMWA